MFSEPKKYFLLLERKLGSCIINISYVCHPFLESSAEKSLDLKDLQSKDMGSLSRDFSRRGYNFEKHRVEEKKVKLTNSAVAQVVRMVCLHLLCKSRFRYF